MNRLLIVSCSRSKRPEAQLLPAYERYNGPAFHLLRRYLKTSTDIPDIRILSAEYGLITYDFHIPYYERRMTAQRAQELGPQVTRELNTLLKVNNHKNGHGVFIYLGKDYLRTLEGSNIFPPKCAVKVAAGTPGKRLADLYSWLYGESSLPGRQLVAKQSNDNIHIRGIKIRLEREEVLIAARRAIKNGVRDRACYHSWYVLVDNARVSPKWLVSLLTGLPVSAFHSDEARRVLFQLGMEVMRV
jgi:uncharacterized protein DUF6884